jgi:hypothetical protein
MIRDKLLLMTTLFLFAQSNIAFAAMTGNYYSYIYKVNVGIDNYLLINTPGNLDTNVHGSCAQPYYAKSQWPLSDARTKAMLSMATASFLGRRRVYLITNGCSSDGRFNLIGIQLEDPL